MKAGTHVDQRELRILRLELTGLGAILEIQHGGLLFSEIKLTKTIMSKLNLFVQKNHILEVD